MGEIKNPFSFGTGDIDKDLWLRDIDNEQEDFITRYGSATNKHRTALLRQAFQDLRTRIANGDMLNRTADGLYQFGSALNRDDKHMQEAYQRALGFMGDLARRQLNTPTPEPEKKKITGSTIEDEFKKSLGPDGRFNEKAYWARTPEARANDLYLFLSGFKNRLNDYQDFSSFTDRTGLESTLDAAIKALNDKKYDDWSLSLLGFTSDWINKPAEEVDEKPKSEDEILDLLLADIKAEEERKKKRALIERSNNRGIKTFHFSTPTYNLKSAFDEYMGNTGASTLDSIMLAPWRNQISYRQPKESDVIAFRGSQIVDLNNYFNNFATNYSSLYNNNASNLGYMLGRLIASRDNGQSYEFLNTLNRYLTPIGNGSYIINGTYKPNGRFAIYNTLGQDAGIQELNIEDIPDENTREALKLQLLQFKNGGSIPKYAGGGLTEDLSYYGVKSTPSISQPTQSQGNKTKDSTEEMTTGDWVNILGPVTLDIGSMLTANIPGYGTLASGITGLGSTVWSGINDAFKGQFSAAGTLASLGADAFGLVPGWGMSAKVGKIAKNVLRYSKPIMYAFTARGLTDAGNVLAKGIDKGFDSLDKNDWEQLAAGFTSLMGGAAKGTAAIKRSNLQEMRRASASKKTFNYIDNNGDIKSKTVGINDDISGELRVSRPKISADKEGVIKGRTQALDGFNAGYGIASNKRFGMLYEQARQGDVPLHSWETWEWKVPRLINTDKAKQQLMKLRGSQKPKTETPKAETPKTESKTKSKKKTTPKKKKTEAEKKQIGGILYTLRNGGIIKALLGLSSKYNIGDLDESNPMGSWGNLNWGTALNSSFKDYLTAGYNRRNGISWSRGLYGTSDGDLDIFSAYNAQRNYYNQSEGSNIMGDVKTYFSEWIKENEGKNVNDFILDYNSKVDRLRELNKTKIGVAANTKGPEWDEFNTLHHQIYRNYGLQSDGRDDWSEKLKDILGESTWRRVPNSFDGIQDLQDKRHTFLMGEDPKWQVAMDNEGHLITDNSVNPEGDIKESKTDNSPDNAEIKDRLSGINTNLETKFKNPFDPTLSTIAGKTILGLRGNRDIFGNLLKEMPEASLRDPIDRKLATVGWQEQIKQGQNQLADLRNIYSKLTGSDALVNLAGALEVEGKGRDIMNDKSMKDSERQFETALKSWNLDNEDILYNVKVGDDNRRAIADRARMMAQIRAAWRSGDNNIKMGAFSDASNWLLKKYQREQDLIDKTKELTLGSLESFADWSLRNNPTYKELLAKKQAGTLTEADRAKMLEIRYSVMDDLTNQYAEKFYNLYHTPWFGGGYKSVIGAKDGTKLEVAKLKARSKDNDRYVSMIKDLRQSSRRRRRR